MNSSSTDTSQLEVFELRQYTLHPHKRDVLIDLFDREFLETQDAVGMPVLGQFRDLSDADRFVWLRGFGSMQARHDALSSFYGGPVWQAHRNAANATMIDSDNVLLLRPAWQGASYPWDLSLRAEKNAVHIPTGLIDISIFYLKEPATADLLLYVKDEVAQVLQAGGAAHQGWFITETQENTFTGLPVRKGENVLMGIGLFESLQSFEAFGASQVWQQRIAPKLADYLQSPSQTLRLTPTARSAVHA